MTESRFGFSNSRLQNYASFNPVCRIPIPSNKTDLINLLVNFCETVLHPRLKYTEERLCNGAMSERISHTNVEVKSRRHTGKRPLYDEWIGTAEINGSEVQFMTDCNTIEPGDEYHVVFEKIEITPGDPAIKIHDIINE